MFQVILHVLLCFSFYQTQIVFYKLHYTILRVAKNLQFQYNEWPSARQRVMPSPGTQYDYTKCTISLCEPSELIQIQHHIKHTPDYKVLFVLLVLYMLVSHNNIL